MTSQYEQTWKDFNPADVLLVNFDSENSEQQEPEKLDIKKTAIQMLVTFGLFCAFVYGLRMIDQAYHQPKGKVQGYQIYEVKERIYNNNYIHNQFRDGYIGFNTVDLEGYKFMTGELALNR